MPSAESIVHTAPSGGMSSLPSGFRAIVLGATGAIGAAFVDALSNTPNCEDVVALSRQSEPRLDLEDEHSIETCARALMARAPFHLVIDATGALQIDGFGPEKRIDDLGKNRLLRAFAINSIGPVLVMKHFVPLLPSGSRSIYAKLSARVGSISDNRKGGWYAYRASKAALNMLMRTAAIEFCRKRPEAIFVALQPGTVRSKLSSPYIKGASAMVPETSVALLLNAIDRLPACGQAVFIDYKGGAVPW